MRPSENFKELIIYGAASKSEVKHILITDEDLDIKLMDLLIDHGLPIASSCSGANICKLCMVTDEVISCQNTLRDYLKK
ncbi:hypothetical protein [Bacteriovorax sp. DB6_IX]|uniref:hypothetical protein n=1 Tax=Bacteriovorax sp. DB6_IX TaxID=1353530 RepID=UPI00038A4716|nr:hypothetical protein [Bacteriovorax sp. DB6_IX]EQC51209.1 hypothetical protein M901_1011 [Bacteriovorax sp. DB6_IX]